MAKPNFRILHRNTCNKALVNHGSITFWPVEKAIQAGNTRLPGAASAYSDLAITTVLLVKRVFRLTLRATAVNVSFKTPTRGDIAHQVIDSTGLKVYGEGEWKVKKHGKERRRIWRKRYLVVDAKTHKVICADLSRNNVTDSEAFPGLIRQTRRKIRSAAADSAYDTRLCHDELRHRKISALIPPQKGEGYWPGEYADRTVL